MPLLTEGNELNLKDACEEDMILEDNVAIAVGEEPTNTNELATENKNLKQHIAQLQNVIVSMCVLNQK